jgi:hypothetical protein
MYCFEDTEANKEEIEEGPMINAIVFFTKQVFDRRLLSDRISPSSLHLGVINGIPRYIALSRNKSPASNYEYLAVLKMSRFFTSGKTTSFFLLKKTKTNSLAYNVGLNNIYSSQRDQPILKDLKIYISPNDVLVLVYICFFFFLSGGLSLTYFLNF